MTARTFAALPRYDRQSACRSCGKRTTHAVAITARALRENGSGVGRKVASKQVSLCQACAVEAFVGAERAILAVAGLDRGAEG